MLKTIFKDFSYLPRSIIQYNNKLPYFPTEFINNLQRFQSPQRFIKFPLPNDKKQLKFLYFTTTGNFHSFPTEFISNLQRGKSQLNWFSVDEHKYALRDLKILTFNCLTTAQFSIFTKRKFSILSHRTQKNFKDFNDLYGPFVSWHWIHRNSKKCIHKIY